MTPPKQKELNGLQNIHVPDSLRDLPIFLCWKYEPRQDGDPKPRKVPYYPNGGRRSGRQGSDQDRAQLTTFSEARDQAINRGMTGIGIALLEGYDLVAIDVDNCVTDDGKLPEEITDAIGLTYAEYSPSGRGVRAIMRGDLGNHKSPTMGNEWGWEVFSTKGFCTLTSRMLDHIDVIGLENTIAEVSPRVKAICKRRFPQHSENSKLQDPLVGHQAKLGLTVREMSELLASLDPDMDRDQWIRVGMALHHECQGDDTGFELWDDWSAQGDKYVSTEDLRYQWNSFKEATAGIQPVRMASVIKMAKDNAKQPNGEWDVLLPLPASLPPVPWITVEMMPKELRPWLADIAERMSVPLDFVAIPALVMLGSLIGRKVLVRPEENTEWNEPANLWGAIVDSPGAMKTPAVNQVLAPLREFEKEAMVKNKAALDKHVLDLQVHKTAKEAALAGLKKKAGTCDTLDIEQALMGFAVEPPKPKSKRYIVTDATVEKLGEICADNPNGILYHRDELPTLFADLQREENAASRGFLLTGWTGLESYTFDRIGRGTNYIEAVNISLFGTAQPGPVAKLVQASSVKHNDGMIQRLQLFVWPDLKGDWIPADRKPDSEARDAAFACCRRLSEMIAEDVGAERDDLGAGPFLRLDSGAQAVLLKYRTELEAKVRGQSLPEPRAAHLGKYRGLVPRLALVLHLAGGGTGRISEEAMRQAVNWAYYLEAHTRRMYASVDIATKDTAHLLLDRIRGGDLRDGFSQRDITQKGWTGLRDTDQVEQALAKLEEFSWLKKSTVHTGGRPKEIYHINPAALQRSP